MRFTRIVRRADSLLSVTKQHIFINKNGNFFLKHILTKLGEIGNFFFKNSNKMSEKLTKLIELFNDLDRNPGIYLENLPPALIPADPQSFLFKFFMEFNDQLSTFNKDKFPVTRTGKRRSFNEVYDLILTYFPEYQLLDYFADIYHVAARVWNETDKVILINFCPDIRKNVIYLYGKADCNNYGYFNRSVNYITHPSKNKYFPFYFHWCYKQYLSDFTTLFYDEEITFELLEEKYINFNEKVLEDIKSQICKKVA